MDPRNPHRLNDLRSLAIHRLIAERIEADPSLLERPRARVRAWREAGSVHPYYLQAWADLLDGPIEEVLAVLRDEGERATDLRHNSPFAGIIDQSTRLRIWKEARDLWVRSQQGPS